VEGLITGGVNMQVAEYCSCGRETRKISEQDTEKASRKSKQNKYCLPDWRKAELSGVRHPDVQASKVLPALKFSLIC